MLAVSLDCLVYPMLTVSLDCLVYPMLAVSLDCQLVYPCWQSQIVLILPCWYNPVSLDYCQHCVPYVDSISGYCQHSVPKTIQRYCSGLSSVPLCSLDTVNIVYQYVVSISRLSCVPNMLADNLWIANICTLC